MAGSHLAVSDGRLECPGLQPGNREPRQHQSDWVAEIDLMVFSAQWKDNC